MTDNERNLNDILKYLPEPSEQELKAIHDRVLNRLASAMEARGLDKTAFLKAATEQEPE